MHNIISIVELTVIFHGLMTMENFCLHDVLYNLQTSILSIYHTRYCPIILQLSFSLSLHSSYKILGPVLFLFYLNAFKYVTAFSCDKLADHNGYIQVRIPVFWAWSVTWRSLAEHYYGSQLYSSLMYHLKGNPCSNERERERESYLEFGVFLEGACWTLWESKVL